MEPPIRVLHSVPEPLGLFFRPSRNDHHVLSQFLSEDRTGMSGVVFDAEHVGRQEELRAEVSHRNLEALLDPRLMELATLSGFTERRRALPWGGDRPHLLSDLAGRRGQTIVEVLADFVVANGSTAVLAPTHFLAEGIRDPWLALDLDLTRRLRDRLDLRGATDVAIYYPLAMSTKLFFDSAQRHMLTSALRGLGIDGLWLRIHPFGADSGHLTLRRYIAACRDMHNLSVPLIAERTGNVGLALLGFGAVGGIESGVSSGDKFGFGRLSRKPLQQKPFAPPPRVYVPALGGFLPRQDASEFLKSRTARASFACRNTACCRRGADDMLANARRHFVFTRLEEVRLLGSVPATDRAEHYLNSLLRPASDKFGKALQLADHSSLKEKLERQRLRLDDWRHTLGEMARIPGSTFSPVPFRRVRRQRGQGVVSTSGGEISHV